MRTRTCSLAALAGVALLVSACDISILGDEPTRGELGVAEFAWDEGTFGCLFGCDAAEPMAVGAVAHLWVLNDEELPLFVAESDDPSTIAFVQDGPGDTSIAAWAYQQGTAKLILSDAGSGEVVDRLPVDARDVASIEVADPELYAQTYTIMVGGETEIQLTLRDSDDHALKGIGAVEYSLSGGISGQQVDLISALADYIVSIFTGTVTEYCSLAALEVGTGTLSITALSGASLEIPVAIVDGSAATAIDIQARGALEAPGAMIVDAFVRAGAEPLHSAECQWSLSPADGPVQIDWALRDAIQLKADTPGTAELTCQVGDVTGSAEMIFR